MLFLFDIDGTLLRGMPPIHRLALCDAALRVYDVHLAPAELGETAGMTDTLIIQRALSATKLPKSIIEAGLSAFFAEAADAYQGRMLADLRPFHTPHAQATLERLTQVGACLGLVTGNIQRIAWAKLSAAGLADYFTGGGFGDEAAEREKLPPLAIARLQASYGRTFTPECIYVVGDTPADVACGAACGLATIAVATGPIYSPEELHAAGADYVLEDLGALGTLEICPDTPS